MCSNLDFNSVITTPDARYRHPTGGSVAGRFLDSSHSLSAPAFSSGALHDGVFQPSLLPADDDPASAAFASSTFLGLPEANCPIAYQGNFPCEVHVVQNGTCSVEWRLFSGSFTPPAIIPGAVLGDIYWTPNNETIEVWQLQIQGTWKLLDTSPEVTAKNNSHPAARPLLPLRYWPSSGDTAPRYVTSNAYNSWRSRKKARLSTGQEAEKKYLEAGPLGADDGLAVLDRSEKSSGIRGGLAIRGSELPSNANVIPMRVDGTIFHVCLPRISNALYQLKHAKSNYDSMVREITAVVGGQDPQLDLGGFVSYDATEPDLPQKIADAMGNNRVVLVRNYQGDRLLTWNDAYTIQRPTTIMTPHSQTRRLCQDPKDKKYTIHKRMPFREFVEASTDVTKCYNLLDCNSRRQGAPEFLRPILAEREALEATYNQGLLVRGLSAIDLDMLNPLSWYLLAHSGYYTAGHHDACGYCTYIWVQCGVKLWSWQRIPAGMPSYKDVLNATCAQFAPAPVVEGSWFTARLGPGDILIQPPNLVHRVYTAERSIIKGGHFYSWQSLHLTEMARLIDVKYNEIATNEDHDAAARLLARMAMSLGSGFDTSVPLPPFFHGISERALLSLHRMVSSPDNYAVQKSSSKGPTTGGPHARAADYSLLPAGDDDDDGNWSDPDEDPGTALEFIPPAYVRGTLLPAQQDEHADFLIGTIILSLIVHSLGADRRVELSSYDSAELAWDAPGASLPSLPEWPMARILRLADQRLKGVSGLKPKPDQQTTQPYVLDGVAEYEVVGGIVKKVLKDIGIQAGPVATRSRAGKRKR